MRRVTLRTVPLTVEVRHPTFLYAGREGPSGQQPLFGRAVITAINGTTYTVGDPTTDDWPVGSSIHIGAFRKGAGWSVYKAALLARGCPVEEIVEATDPTIGETVTFEGETALHFLSLFQDVILLHGCPSRVVERVKQYSHIGTQVRFWFLSDRTATGPLYTDWEQAIRLAGLPYLLVGSSRTCNSIATTNVDPYETLPWSSSPPHDGLCHSYPGHESAWPGEGSGHAWFFDARGTSWANAVSAACKSQWDTYWSQSGTRTIDGFHTDNSGIHFDPGLATNAPTVLDADWKGGFDNLFAAFYSAFFGVQEEARRLSANIGDHSRAGLFTGCLRQFWEHTFIKGDDSDFFTIAEVKNGMNAAMDLGARVWFGQSQRGNHIAQQFLSADHPDLREMLETSRARGRTADFRACFYSDGGPTNTSGVLYWGPTMETPT